MDLDSDVVALFQGHLDRLRDEMELIDKHLHRHPEMTPWMADEWSALWGELHDATNAVSCEQCEGVVATVVSWQGRICQACHDKVAA